jgi:hypothetical protein
VDVVGYVVWHPSITGLPATTFGVLSSNLEEPDLTVFRPPECLSTWIGNFAHTEPTPTHELHGNFSFPPGGTSSPLKMIQLIRRQPAFNDSI